MNRNRRLVLVVTVTAVLLAASLLTWRSAAAPAAQAPAPGGRAGQVNPAAAPAPEAPVPGGPGFLMVSPYQFKPRHPGDGWDYADLDLYNPGSSSVFYDAAFSLPNQVTITEMVVYFYDNCGDDLNLYLWRGDPATGNYDVMALVTTSGAQDQYRNAAETSISYAAVDQQSYTYLITAVIPPLGSHLRLAAVRIDYAYAVDLPLVLKDH